MTINAAKKVRSNRSSVTLEQARRSITSVRDMVTRETERLGGSDLPINTALLVMIATELTMLGVTWDEFLELTYGVTRDERQPATGIANVGDKPPSMPTDERQDI